LVVEGSRALQTFFVLDRDDARVLVWARMNRAPSPSDAEIASLEPVLHAYAMRAVGDRDAAHELVQETLVAVLSGRAAFAGRSRLRTWAIGILTHKVMDLFRARRRSSEHVDDSSLEDLAEPIAHRPDRVLARRESISVLEAGLRELPEQERLAILLIDVEGFDRDEACAQLAITANHLRVLLHRGRHRLRRLLESVGVSNGT
jgi:RNA polymerase sigma-70 factor (ECF subfamily)